MSVLTDLISGGAEAVAGFTESAVNTALTKYGAEREVFFPNTNCFFPVLYGFSGIRVRKLGDLPTGIQYQKSLIRTNEKTLEAASKAGLSALLGAEILEGLKYLEKEPSAGAFFPDEAVCAFASRMRTESIPGAAIILSRADTPEDFLSVIRNYQRKGIVTFLAGSSIEQCARDGMEMGAGRRLIPLGREPFSMIHAISAAVRCAMLTGGIQPGDSDGILRYTAAGTPVFVNTFGSVDAIGFSVIVGAMALGFPAVMDMDLGENQIPGLLESECDHSGTVKKSLNLAGVKIHVRDLLNWTMENEKAALADKRKDNLPEHSGDTI